MKTTTLLVSLLFSFSLFSQTTASTSDGKEVLLNDDGTWKYAETLITAPSKIHVSKEVDDMTDKVYYYPSEKLICQDKSRGFSLKFNIDGKTDNSIKVGGISVKVIGLECVEKTELLFLFEDDSKLSVTSWNKFNCKGNAWYKLTSVQLKSMSTKKIKKVRVQNGHNFKSYTHELSNEQSSYLIDSYQSIKDKNIVVEK